MTHALDLFKLEGKVALVTGGTRGLGYFAAEALAEAGADVASCARETAGSLDGAVEKLRGLGRDCIGIKCDVTKEADVLGMAAVIKEHYGGCDILVNNAGTGAMIPSLHMTTEAFAGMLTTTLPGTFLCCRELGKLMIEQESGSIINVSSEN